MWVCWVIYSVQYTQIRSEEKRSHKLYKCLTEALHFILLDQIQDISQSILVILAAGCQNIVIGILKPFHFVIVDLLHVFKWIIFMEFDSWLEAMQELQFSNFQAYVGVLDGMNKIQRSLFDPKSNVFLLNELGVRLLWDLEDGHEDLSMWRKMIIVHYLRMAEYFGSWFFVQPLQPIFSRLHD